MARVLRREEGASIKEIARRIGVSTSSVSHWVRDIELTPEQHEQLLLRNPIYNAQRSGTWIQAVRHREERQARQEEGRLRARRRDVSFVAGCMLYWAEGAKKRNQLQFANSDPEMVRFFVDFLRTHFGLTGELLQVQQEETGGHAPVWDLSCCRLEDECRPDHLRSNPGARRFRARRLAGIDPSCPRARKNATTAS
jgi:transposase-like protein